MTMTDEHLLIKRLKADTKQAKTNMTHQENKKCSKGKSSITEQTDFRQSNRLLTTRLK